MVADYEVGLGMAGSLKPAEYEAIATAAEGYGFDAITVFGDLMFQPPIMPLITMAESTSRIRLGIACYNPWTLHPVEIAGQVAYLDRVSEGRAFYGFVRGAWLDTLGINQTRSIAAIRDSVQIVRKLLAGEPDGYEGDIYELKPHTNLFYEPLRSEVPLMIGTWSPALAKLAGEEADEIQAGGCSSSNMVEHLESLAAHGLRARTRAGVPGVCLNAVTVVDTDRKAARARARAETVLYFEVVAGLDPFVTLDPELLARIGVLLKSKDYEAAGNLIPDDLLDRFAFSGTPDDVARQAAEIINAGAKRVEFDTPFGMSPDYGLAMLGAEVLPRMRSLLA
ncbi:MAG: LLM class flavin-dependent oxidoreductase [Actinobacteria bacterium]|nr:LLM class flavin-dependent oxidoreductase [Actinomycetota bacterium]